MYAGSTVAAVVPAYNEQAHVGDVIETLPAFVDRAYVVDDASTDDTWDAIQTHADVEVTADADQPADGAPVGDGGHESEPYGDVVAEPEAAAEPAVVAIQHAANRGVGGAIKTGYARALADEMDVTVVISGDGQTEPDIVERIVAPVAEGRAGYAKGNRLLDRDRSEMPAFRQFGNVLLSVLTKIASGYWRLMDPQNGSTAISLAALEQVDLDALYEDYGFANDLLVRLNAHGVCVADVARRAVYKDETSHIRYRTFVPKLSSLLLRDFLWRLRTKYLMREFHPLVFLYGLGVAGVGAGLASGLSQLAERTADDSLTESATLSLLGGLCLVLAMVFDMEENESLQRREDGRR